jgi:streptogramin lyase
MLYALTARYRSTALSQRVYKFRKLLIGLVLLFLPAAAAAQTATVLANAATGN